MPSLYVLAGEYRAIEQKLLDSDLDETTIADTLEGAAGDLEEKAVNVAMFIRNLESSADQIDIAIKQMQERKKAIENKADSIKKYLLENMQRTGINKIESPYFSVQLKKNPPSVVIDNESYINEKYKVTKTVTTTSIDKESIKLAIKNGEIVTGAHIEQKERIEIK